MLQKIASMVKPIMRQRNWRVGVLTEFYPRESNLLGLNVNGGEKICLRLRHAGDDTQFLPFESVLDTMLHELCHIVHGPHNQAFNALWDKLRDEHEALLRKGYTGEGFLGKGNRLGGRRIPMSEIKRQARAAAERRRELSKGSGQRLGGQGIVRGQNAREIIAAAAEKRLRIERGCGSVTDHGAQLAREKDKVTTTKAAKQDENDAALMQAFIDLIQEEESELFGKDYVAPSHENPAGIRGATSPPGLRTSMLPTLDARALRDQQQQIERQLLETKKTEAEADVRDSTSSVPKRSAAKRPAEREPEAEAEAEADTWTCEICTLINPMQYLMCGACETERPAMYAQPALHPFSVPSHSRPQSRTTTTTRSSSSARSNTHGHAILKPRLSSAEALAKFDSQASAKAQSRPVGWMCHGCGNWMESQWWTCSSCGRMKTSS